MKTFDLSKNNLGVYDSERHETYHYPLKELSLRHKKLLFDTLVKDQTRVVIEGYAYGAKGRITDIAEVTGIFLLACDERFIEVERIAIPTWKSKLPKDCPNKKTENKQYIQFSMDESGCWMDTDHEADAYWIYQTWKSNQ